ncbi:MAG: hypothetical protein H6753_05805 [Candidatus Omnitrophica bacterium]|nr:hypothetical protein [Candidatus Omnitrophota bacterium]
MPLKKSLIITISVLTFMTLASFFAFAETNSFEFSFKSGLFSTQYLLITNRDTKRALEFYGCYNRSGGTLTTETSYFVVMKDGIKHYFDSPMFCEIGQKGRYWVNPGTSGKIPFKIKKELLRNADKVVFQGISFTPVQTNGFIDLTDKKQLLISYNVSSGKIVYDENQMSADNTFGQKTIFRGTGEEEGKYNFRLKGQLK